LSARGATVERLRSNPSPLLVGGDEPASWGSLVLEHDVGERDALRRLGAELLLPLSTKERLLGFVSLGAKLSEEPFSSGDARLLRSLAAQTGLALENSRLAEAIAIEVAQRELQRRELEIAREVQEQLFPQRQPPAPGFDYCGACRPARHVGGDYYDFLALPEEVVGIAIGDVSGKGIPAALLMAGLQASLRAQAPLRTRDLPGLVASINRLLYDLSSSNRYATFFYAQLDTRRRTLTYVNAGHNPPMLLRNGEVLRLDVGGLVVGLLPETSYELGSLALERGDLLVAYTDGVSEAMSPAEDEWGEERLVAALRGNVGRAAADVVASIMAAADEFASGAPQHDDMTLVVVRALAH
jgi:sigma-B regulation protein RsbU (phosphoserine phosphatase)